MVDENINSVLENKKKEERRIILSRIISDKFSLINQIRALKFSLQDLDLDISNSDHKSWVEEFVILLEDDEEIDISLDNVDIDFDDKGDAVLIFDFDDILENEVFNQGYRIKLDYIIDENGYFDIFAFKDKLKECVKQSLQKMKSMK